MRKDWCASALDLPLGLCSTFVRHADTDIDVWVSPLKIQHGRFETDNHVAVDVDVAVVTEHGHTREQNTGKGRRHQA